MKPSLPMFEVDRSAPLPLHRQVEAWLRMQISTGGLAPGATLPSRQEMRDMFGGINHLTIRQAIKTLTKEGLLFSIQGRGTFVKEQKKKQLRIALVLPHFNEDLTHDIAEGVQEYFESVRVGDESPVLTVFFDSRGDAQKELDNIRHLQDLPLDGAIVFPVPYGDMLEHVVRLKVDHYPVVVFGWFSGIQVDSVNTDDYKGAYKITRHLLEKGRRRIAWLGTKDCSLSAEYWTDLRWEGYRDALNDFNVPCDRKLCGDMKMPSPLAEFEPILIEALDRILAVDPTLDAIVCNNDFQALTCLRELPKRGFRVPQDIAVVGFDDLRAAAVSTPPLTTVRTPKNLLGQEAARILLARIQDPTRPTESVIVPASLIVRQSS